MRKFSLQDQVFILISWALMSMYSVAEHEFFLQSENHNWDEARNHCQVCFKDLVTVTPGNTQSIARNLTSDSWIGLRKNFDPSSNSTSNSTSNSSMPWTRWANGDPLAFQNWYPGWPVFKSSFPRRDCCSCSCTCPAMRAPTMTSFTTYTDFTTPDLMNFTGSGEGTTENWMNVTSFTDVTDQPVTDVTDNAEIIAECVRSPMVLPDVPDPDENYIEDSCVAMLSYGSWVEKNCSDLLPFICYEEHFVCQADVANVTAVSAVLTWPAGPGAISHYRVEVRGDKNWTASMNNFTYGLTDLTPGSRYSVQVFPVKCDRDLNSQEVFFYTIPSKVENLTVTMVTETSVFLSWDKPAGNADFYYVEFQGNRTCSDMVEKEVHGLRPGSSYTFTVITGVSNRLSEALNITTHTKPGKVTSLNVTENTRESLLLTWKPPEGSVTAFFVVAKNDSNYTFIENKVTCNASQVQQEVNVTTLPMGTNITLSVTALANHIRGDSVTISNYTAPGPISNLVLETTSESLNANWSPSAGNYPSFKVELRMNGTDDLVIERPSTPEARFTGLKTAAEYIVKVYSVIGHLVSSPVEGSKFTKPRQPTHVSVSNFNETQITFQWKAPPNIVNAKYLVNLNSKFWGQSLTGNVDNKTSYTFDNLKSGTIYDFQVRTMADQDLSPPLCMSHQTEPQLREIGLSMLCSSSEPLHCANENTRKLIFEQLQEHFNRTLEGGVFWKLETRESEHTAE
ncbi:receptor-type tyrosine-protein phosphatase eta-like [Trachinotus anak]|uniref:receptor-type tyrosine-protein phosphatase eta-like n=1 Tax=Trachinotus anak TaxID=443729 RepID=UPI0039F1EA70